MTEEKKKALIPLIIAGFILVIFASFFAGLFFGKAKGKETNKIGASEATGRFQQDGTMMPRGAGRMQGDRPTIGEVTAISGNNISMTTQNSSESKTIGVADNTNITDNGVDATISTIKVGDTLIVTGLTNTDGSIKAQMIKINPILSTPSKTGSPQQNN